MNPVEVRRISDPSEFLEAAGPLLLADEARHNLILGIAGTLRDRPGYYPEFRLWCVERRRRASWRAALADAAAQRRRSREPAERGRARASRRRDRSRRHRPARRHRRGAGGRPLRRRVGSAQPERGAACERTAGSTGSSSAPGRGCGRPSAGRDKRGSAAARRLARRVQRRGPRGRALAVSPTPSAWWTRGVRAPDSGFLLWVDDAPVSMAGWGRPTPTASGSAPSTRRPTTAGGVTAARSPLQCRRAARLRAAVLLPLHRPREPDLATRSTWTSATSRSATRSTTPSSTRRRVGARDGSAARALGLRRSRRDGAPLSRRSSSARPTCGDAGRDPDAARPRDGLRGRLRGRRAAASKRRRRTAARARRARVRIDLERGRLRRSGGDAEAALPLFESAFAAATRRRGAVPRRRRRAHGRARRTRSGRLRRVDEARHRVAESDDAAAVLARAAAQQPRLGALRGGRARGRARRLRARARRARARPGERRAAIALARYAVGKTLRALGRPDEAAALLEQAVAWAEAEGKPDGWFHEELAESYAALGGAMRAARESRSAATSRRPVFEADGERARLRSSPREARTLESTAHDRRPSPRRSVSEVVSSGGSATMQRLAESLSAPRYSGMFPCFRFGFGSRFVSAVSSAENENGPRPPRLDHVVDVASLGSRVRVREALLVVGDQLLAARIRIVRLGELVPEDDVHRALRAP